MIRKNKSKQLKLKIKMQIKNKIKPYIELKNMKNKKSTINNEMIWIKQKTTNKTKIKVTTKQKQHKMIKKIKQ